MWFSCNTLHVPRTSGFLCIAAYALHRLGSSARTRERLRQPHGHVVWLWPIRAHARQQNVPSSRMWTDPRTIRTRRTTGLRRSQHDTRIIRCPARLLVQSKAHTLDRTIRALRRVASGFAPACLRMCGSSAACGRYRRTFRPDHRRRVDPHARRRSRWPTASARPTGHPRWRRRRVLRPHTCVLPPRRFIRARAAMDCQWVPGPAPFGSSADPRGVTARGANEHGPMYGTSAHAGTTPMGRCNFQLGSVHPRAWDATRT